MRLIQSSGYLNGKCSRVVSVGSGPFFNRFESVSPSRYSITRKSIGPSADVIQGTDIRMVQAGNRPCLSFKSLPQISSLRQMSRQNLDRYRPIQPSISSLINLSHPAGPNTPRTL